MEQPPLDILKARANLTRCDCCESPAGENILLEAARRAGVPVPESPAGVALSSEEQEREAERALEEERHFQVWLTEQPERIHSLENKEQRSLFRLEEELRELEAESSAWDAEDKGRYLHAFWWRWRGLASRHEEYLNRYKALLDSNELTSALA